MKVHGINMNVKSTHYPSVRVFKSSSRLFVFKDGRLISCIRYAGPARGTVSRTNYDLNTCINEDYIKEITE